MKRYALLLGLLPMLVGVDCQVAIAQTSQRSNETSIIAVAAREPNYDAYSNTLSTYVNEQGLVDYLALQNNRQTLDAFNASLWLVAEATYDSWTEADQIAFWVNAYNSLTLKSIIDEDPLKDSIRKMPGVWNSNRHPILQQRKTLGNIEHKVLRVDFNEPRIHMALVCAAISCPYLRTEPYTGEQLDAQLDEQTRTFLSIPNNFRIDAEDDTVYLSSIFKWFGKDWIPTYGTDEFISGSEKERAVLNFISGYLSEEDKTYLQTGDYRVRYTNYDWALNIQDSQE